MTDSGTVPNGTVHISQISNEQLRTEFSTLERSGSVNAPHGNQTQPVTSAQRDNPGFLVWVAALLAVAAVVAVFIVSETPSASAESEIAPPPIVLSHTSIVAGTTISATAVLCPDLSAPVLGGDYRVVFQGQSSEPGTGWEQTVIGTSNGDGSHTAVFTIPATAPTDGTYEISAVCQFSELSPFTDFLIYLPATFTVTPTTVTPTPTPTPEATPVPRPTQEPAYGTPATANRPDAPASAPAGSGGAGSTGSGSGIATNATGSTGTNVRPAFTG